jgi:phospholipid/cholesterol/gamma-HCH transport system substrate-binding protein
VPGNPLDHGAEPASAERNAASPPAPRGVDEQTAVTRNGALRTTAGTITVVGIIGVVALAAALFRGDLTESVPVTVISDRAGLVMNPEAKVKMIGVQVGTVSSIEALPNGQAAIHLAIEPAKLDVIPSNVVVDIGSTTVFGGKSVQLVPPPDPSPHPLRAGQVLDAQHVSVETDTLFQQLTSVLSKVEPQKLNETLGALAAAFNDRGEKFGQALSDFNRFLAKFEPSLPQLSHDIEVAPTVLNAYADAAPDLMNTLDNTTRLSQTLVDEQQNLDAFLVSTIGLADIGNDVIGTNRQALTDLAHMLVPTTDLLNEYHQALNCALTGLVPLMDQPPTPEPGVVVQVGFVLGTERYRYPANLPKVAGTGGPHCLDLPDVPYEKREPFVIADTNANPAQYGNQGILLNSDGLKQWLFGPLDGPPRNSAQIGQPG